MIDRLTSRTVLAVLMFCFAAQASADDVLEQARQLAQSQQGRAAYALLAPLEDERAGDPAYDYLLGITALDSGEPGIAVFALERVLAVQPDNDLARAEIARAYFELSELENARAQLETVRDSDTVPPEARASMERYLSAINKAEGGGTSISGYLTLAGGYDSNINSATDQSQVVIPFLGNNLLFQLVDRGQEQDSAYAMVAGGVNVAHPLGDRWSVVGGARGYYRFTEDPFQTQDIYLYGGVRGNFGKHDVTIAAQGENFQINHDTLRYVYGGFGQYRYALDNRSQLSLALQISKIAYPKVRNRDVIRYVGSAGYVRALGGKREPIIYAGVYGGTEDEQKNQFQQFGHELYGGRFGGSIEVRSRLRAFASFSWEERDYGGLDTIFQRQRDDTQMIASGGLEYAPGETWRVRPNISYTRNDSNIPINDYDRVVVGVNVTMRF